MSIVSISKKITPYSNDEILLSLAPNGMVEGEIESMAGYLCRLAKLHDMPVRAFSRRIQDYYCKQVVSNNHEKVRAMVGTNGVGKIAYNVVEAVAKGGATDDSYKLTLLPWKPLIEARTLGVFKQNIHFCYECLQQDIESNNEPYLRLLWMLKPYTSCSTHKVKLFDACPHCNHPLEVSPLLLEHYFCMHCRQDIVDMESICHEPANNSEIWLASNLSEFMQATHNQDQCLHPKCVSHAIRYLLQEYCDNDLSVFEQRMGMVKNSARKWHEEKCMPRFSNIIRLLTVFKVPAKDLFLTKNMQLNLDSNLKIEYTPPKPKRPKIASPRKLKNLKNELVKQLESKNPLKPISTVGAKLKMTYLMIQYHEPELYKRYREKWEEQKRKEVEIIKQQRILKVKRVAMKFLDQGVYPSQRKLKATSEVRVSDLMRVEVKEMLLALIEKYE